MNDMKLKRDMANLLLYIAENEAISGYLPVVISNDYDKDTEEIKLHIDFIKLKEENRK